MQASQETTVELGERYRDSLTGVEGVATARINFLHGCERITLEVMKKDTLMFVVSSLYVRMSTTAFATGCEDLPDDDLF